MKTVFDPNRKARMEVDDEGRVRSISHPQEYWESGEADPVEAAIDYLTDVAGIMGMRETEMGDVRESVDFFSPKKAGVEYRLSDVKKRFDSTTVTFAQTYLNVPVWRAGVSVTVKQGNRVVGMLNNSQEVGEARLPPKARIEQYQELLSLGEKTEMPGKTVAETGPRSAGETAQGADFVRGLLDRGQMESQPGGRGEEEPWRDEAKLIRGRFFVYRYDAANRLPQPQDRQAEPMEGGIEPVLPLKPVPKKIKDGEYYTVAEVTFTYATPEYGLMNWLALVEPETNAVLYLRALTSGVSGRVYKRDPITSSGAAGKMPDRPNAELDPFRTWETLPNLDPPDGTGKQHLRGALAEVKDIEALTVAPPTANPATGFDFHVRTMDFAAVNAYYHVDDFFAVLDSLGFDRATYFDGTTFPIGVDHRGMGAGYTNTVNAWCIGNGAGGISHVSFALGDTTDMANPLGRALDSRCTWHELGGHGVLYDHVDSPNFGFSHSAGDSLSAIHHDPDSKATDRFRYAPWNPINTRRFDRDAAAGWGWGGAHDNHGYGSEEILCTTMFRIYRSIGGDSPDLATRRFASRMAMWLILHTIEGFTEVTNPSSAAAFAAAMIIADADNWTSEGVYGGAYGKVVRWSFEKQGLYGGNPPPVDVYIDDGRGGEYQYLQYHWECPSIWNRRAPDGGLAHEAPKEGVTNYAYVKIKNRGTAQAKNVKVRGYHSKPACGVAWPHDLQPMATAELAAGTLNGNNAQEKVVGPFEWVPNANYWGHDCMLMIVTADDDPSNVSNIVAGEWLPDWRLVPNDNNIGQRNVVFAPVSTPQALIDWLDRRSVLLGNPHLKAAKVELKVSLPNILRSRGWRLSFEGIDHNEFELPAQQAREVVMRLKVGKPFTKQNVLKARLRNIRVVAYADGVQIGGMTYRLEP